jgi:AhpD family alkylhydroperoxidase
MNNKKFALTDLPKGYLDGLLKSSYYIRTSELDSRLVELINHRVSQINSCAFCLDMHHKDAVNIGETEQRLHGLSAWRDTPYYTPQERAALQFAEAVTAGNVPQYVMDELEQYFSDTEIANLGLAIVNINAWNKLNKVLQPVAGTYRVGAFA